MMLSYQAAICVVAGKTYEQMPAAAVAPGVAPEMSDVGMWCVAANVAAAAA